MKPCTSIMPNATGFEIEGQSFENLTLHPREKRIKLPPLLQHEEALMMLQEELALREARLPSFYLPKGKHQYSFGGTVSLTLPVLFN